MGKAADVALAPGKRYTRGVKGLGIVVALGATLAAGCGLTESEQTKLAHGLSVDCPEVEPGTTAAQAATQQAGLPTILADRLAIGA